MKEQEPENKAENDKRTPEANCACTFETYGEERIKREICMDISAKKKLHALDEGINPTRLRVMINKEINDSLKRINNSIKDAMQTLVKCSMEEKKPILPSKGPKGTSDACRTRALEEHYKKSLNDRCTNRQTTCHASWQRNNLFTFDNSHLCTKMHGNAISLSKQNEMDNESNSKMHSKSANNVNTDNSRMTGNVNIYSEANNNAKSNKNSRPQSYTDTSSNTITEQSNSRSASASSASSCKLINSMKEKRKKLLAEQLPNFIHEKSNDDNTVRDNSRQESSEANSKEEADVRVNDENIRCKDTTSSTKDGCYCKDMDSVDLQQNSCLTVPCSSLNACGNTRRSQSWMTIYPLEARARLDDSDVFLSRAICTNVEQRNYRKNNNCDVRGNDSEYTMSVDHAVDDRRCRLPKPIYTDDEDPKECFADRCKYRNKIFHDSVINCNDIRKKQIGYKLLRQSLGSCQREQMARHLSTCGCIAEEDEDYYKNDEDKKELSQNVCNVAECPGKKSVYRTPRRLAEIATVCETSFDAFGKRFETARTYKDSAEHSKGTSVCETRFGNSKEYPNVTRVCKKFVTEEPPEDITVCKTVFGEPNGLPEEAIVYKTALSDSEGTPKETICKEIPDLNFANQDNVNRVSLNDVKDKLVKESTNSSNLNGPEENAGNKRIVQLNNKHDNIALKNFTGQQSANVEQDERMKTTLNDRSKNLPRIPIELIKNFKPLSRNVHSTLPRVQLYNRSYLVSNSSINKTSKTFVNQRRMQSLNQSTRNHFQQSNDFTQNLTPNTNNQLEEKTRENLQEGEEQDISKEINATQDNQRESLLHRPFKKLIDVIKRGKTFIIDRIETGKTEANNTITDGKKDEKSEIASETENKTNDIKNQQEIIEKITIPMKSLQTEIADKEKKIDIQRTDKTMPKLLRVMAAKREREKSHVLPTMMTTDSKPQEPEVVVPAEIVTTTHVDREKIPEGKVTLQEYSSAEVTEEIKKGDLSMPEMSVVAIETSVEDAPKDKDKIDEAKTSQALDEIAKTHVACPQKKPEEDLQKPILCKCGLLSDPSSHSCSIAKCVKDRVPCPQKKSEEEPQKSTLCKRELPSNSNNYSCSIVKCTKCNNIIQDYSCKDNGFEQKKIYCAHCCLSTMQGTCLSYLRSCLKTDKPKFRSVSPLKISSHICTNCCIRRWKERKYRKATIYRHSHEECRWYATRDYSRIIDKCKCGSKVSCINCNRPRNQCCCATFTFVKCHKIKEGCNRKRTMICLYCDNPQDKCTCRAPIGKCLYCGLPSDVCNCQDDETHTRDYERIVKRPNRTIHVTSWKPKREIRQYFARNFEDFQSYSTEECRCCEKPKRQRPELPYQRLNIFSEVMNELQQKMSESVCCARCWRNPCCCGSLVDQDKRKEERKAENRVKSKSANNCRCSPKPRKEHKSTVEKSIPIRHIGCKLTPCRCKKDRSYCKRPLAKCYYCKSLPCTCVTVK